MSDQGNVLQGCAPAYKNTGFNRTCFTEFGAPVGILFVQFGQTFPTSSASALKTALSAAILNDIPSQRCYPVQDIVDIVDGSEKPVVVTNNLGGKKKVRDGFTDLMLGWWDGAFCLLYALRNMNNTLMPFLIITNKGFLVGTDAGPGLMKGITATLKDAEPFGWSDGAKLNTYNLHLNFDPAQTNENVKFFDFNGVGGGGLQYLSSLTGLENIILNKQSRTPSGLITVGLTSGCGGVDLFQIYPTQFVASLWKAYADNAGLPNLAKPIAITSVTPGVDGYGVQLNISDANYPILPAPGTPTSTPGASGGTLAANTYYIKQTALNAYGETIGSAEASATTSGSTSSIGVTNGSVAGAVSYRTYIGTSAGSESVYFASPTPAITITSMSGGVSASVPVSNTTGGPVWIGNAGPTELLAAGIGGSDGSSGFEGALVQM